MIVVKLIGGLGNQLFQYALGRKLAIKHNTDIVLDTTGFETYKLHKFSMQYFAFEKRFATNNDLLLFDESAAGKLSYFQKLKRRIVKPITIHERQFNFDPEVAKLSRGYTYLNGYWQTEKYFSDVREELLSDLNLIKPLENKNLEVASLISKVKSVSVHIRRGDYVTNNDTMKIHGVCDLDYYAKALDIIREKESDAELFVFSDDIPWCKENFKTQLNTHYVDHNNADMNYEDLRLMSLCKHNIIANSSFSWWGAWLNTNREKVVVAPKAWFQTNERDYSDVIPEKWIKI